MKKQKSLFVLLGILAILLVGGAVFFSLRGVSAAHKRQEYFDVYRERAEAYIKSEPEIWSRYGNDVSVTFDGAVTYSESGRGFFDKYIEVFAPRVPDTLEEFANGTELILFRVNINGDPYEITFEKNADGELAVSSLTEVKQ